MVGEREKKRAEFVLGLTRGMSMVELRDYFSFKSVSAVYVKINRLAKFVYKKGEKFFLTKAGRELITKSEIVRLDDSSVHPVFQHNVWVRIDILGWDMKAVQDYVIMLFNKAGVVNRANHLKNSWSYYFDMWGIKCRITKNCLLIHPNPREFNTVREAIDYSNNVAWEVSEKAERFFNFSLRKSNRMEFVYSKQEYALLKTEIAKLYIENRERMQIQDVDGNTRIVIDFSNRVPHFEGVHKELSPIDIDYFQKHFADLCFNKPDTISSIEKRLKKVERRLR